jgi:hypothetical protein
MSDIEFKGVYRVNLFDPLDVWNICWLSYCWMNNRLYKFDNEEEGKSFYEFWQKH